MRTSLHSGGRPISPDPVITLTTDFGYYDPFVGVMKGVILGINRDVHIVDLTHGILPYDIRSAAWMIGTNFRYFPEWSIHVVVVDPGVGSSRRPLVIAADNHFFVGPDNGVFTYIFESCRESLVVGHITDGTYMLSADSPTFQGRDVFAPVAAWLTLKVPLMRFGPLVDDYVRADIPISAKRSSEKVSGDVVLIDRFGNAITNIVRDDLAGIGQDAASLNFTINNMRAVFRRFYSDSKGIGLNVLFNSSGYLEFFVNSGSAADEFGISTGDRVEVSP